MGQPPSGARWNPVPGKSSASGDCAGQQYRLQRSGLDASRPKRLAVVPKLGVLSHAREDGGDHHAREQHTKNQNESVYIPGLVEDDVNQKGRSTQKDDLDGDLPPSRRIAVVRFGSLLRKLPKTMDTKAADVHEEHRRRRLSRFPCKAA